MIRTETVDVNDRIALMRVVGSSFNQGNVSCIALDQGLVFVDTGYKASRTAEFRSEMERRFKKDTLFVLLTHTHWDHIFGIDAFKDVPVISSQEGVESVKKELENDLSEKGRKKVIDETKKWLKENGQTPSKERAEWWENLLEVKVMPPTIGVKAEITFSSNGHSYRYSPIGGHSECSSILHCETDGILITGDNLVAEHASNSPCMLAGFNPEGIKILEKFEKFGVSTFIPGHGPIVGVDYVTKSREWFQSMFDALGVLKSKGIPQEKVVEDSSLPEFFEKSKPRQWDRILEQWYSSV